MTPTAATSHRRGIAFTLTAGLVISLLCLLLFGWIAEEVLRLHTIRFDDAIRSAVHAHSTPTLTLTMRFFSFIGSPLVVWPMLAVGAILFWWVEWQGAALLLLVDVTGAGLLLVALKDVFHRRRPEPFFNYPLPHSYSFPSGHALFSLCLYAGFAYLAADHFKQRGARIAIWLTAAAITLCIGYSRIYLGVHYPSDVLGGYIAGLAWTSAIESAYRVHILRGTRKEKLAVDP